VQIAYAVELSKKNPAGGGIEIVCG